MNRLSDSKNTNEIFKLFKDFVELCENEMWPSERTSPDEVTRAFKLSHLIETYFQRLDSDECVKTFSKWFNEKYNRTICIDSELFLKADDKILEKILSSDTSNEITDCGLTEYFKICGQSRMELIVKKLILESQTIDAVEKYANCAKVSSEVERDLKSELFLNEIMQNLNSVDETIELIMNNNVCDGLTFIFNLILYDDTAYVKAIDALWQYLKCKLALRDDTNAQLWNWIILETDKTIMCQVCKKNAEIISEISSFLRYCGDCMRKQASNFFDDWIIDEDAFPYTEITYKNIVKFFNSIKSDSETVESLVKSINASSKNDPFWNDVYESCQINIDV
ncbi:ubiquitin-fold modifier 1 isoform X1 [Arctopsyche grandis]|uniref:ubiquitin-fold modifier 1 isoform X1 n=1 Tax=Arctopsyche grandis TaxID=121162 RepID=UPI00406D6549